MTLDIRPFGLDEIDRGNISISANEIKLNNLQLPESRRGSTNQENTATEEETSSAIVGVTAQEFTIEVTRYLKGEAEPARLKLIVDNIFSQRFSDPQLISLAQHLELKDKVFDGNQSFLTKSFLNNGSIKLLRGLVAKGIDTFNPESSVTYYVSSEKESVTQQELVSIILDKYEATNQEVRDAARKYFEIIPSPYQLYLYLDAAKQLQEAKLNDRSLSFFQIATNMLYIPESQRPLKPLINLYRHSMYPSSLPFSTRTGVHQNLADMMLLSNPSPDEDHMNSKSKNDARALFQSSSAMLWAIARIGSITYSFSRFKHDVRQIKHSADGTVTSKGPLVEFGGEYIPSPDRTPRSEIVRTVGPQPYGPQIFFEAGKYDFSYTSFNQQRKKVTRKFDKETTISLRQGYYLIENPKYGLLIIRNSSPEFGRSLLSSPVYFIDYSKIGAKGKKLQFSKQDLLYPSPRMFELATSFGNFMNMSQQSVGKLNFILDELQGFFQAYNRWKFDTSETSWRGPSSGRKTKLIGAHLSPGFERLVHHLTALYNQFGSNESFQLAFVHQDYPSWRTYQFIDNEGVQRKTLLVDDKVISALNLLARNRCPREVLVDSNLFNFIQEAGIYKRGELLIQST